MTTIKLSIDHVKPFSIQPGRMPDLFKGDQIIVLGRYRQAGDGLITLTGNISGESKSFTFEGTFKEKDPSNAFIPRLWAHRQVGFLLNEIRLNGEKPELKEEVVTLAKQFGIVTPYTSYLVVEQPTTVQPVVRHVDEEPGDVLMNETLSLKGGTDRKEPSEKAKKLYSVDKPMTEAKKKMEGQKFQSNTGYDAIEVSKAVKKYEDAQVMSQTLESRYIDERLFQFSEGYWIDGKFKKGMKEVKIKYLSDAYFSLLKAYPEVSKFLSLGERVLVVINGKAVIIGDEGQSDLTFVQVRALLQ